MEIIKPFLLVVIASALLYGCGANRDWATASRESAGIAPDPVETDEAVLHVYGADAFGWRGWFAIHTWIAAKRAEEDHYTLYDVVGWRGRYGGRVVRIYQDIPDRYWYGARPQLIKAHTGADAEMLIEQVDEAARAYPWANTYKAFPGPNSNTFTAWIARQVPGLGLDLPFSAIGSGYVSAAD